MNRLPPSLMVDPLVNQRIKGDLIISFASGPLCEMTYRPLGLNSLWALIGAVASLTESLAFEIKTSMTAQGLMGGLNGGSFCLFKIGSNSINVLTPSPIDVKGASRITIEDKRHGTIFWVPDRAMMSFEGLVQVGNHLLLGENAYFDTSVGQKNTDWAGEKYNPPRPNAA